jgi:hypothetical protein
MSAMQVNDSSYMIQCDDYDSDDGVELMAVKDDLPVQHPRRKKHTMCLQGWLGRHQALILVDSGSVATFINSSFADKCGVLQEPTSVSKYTTADGGLLLCDKIVLKLQWYCQVKVP